MTDHLSEALIRLAAAEERAAQLRSELEPIERDMAKLRQFIDIGRELFDQDFIAEGIARRVDASAKPISGSLALRSESLAGMAAALILRNGPMSIAAMARQLIEDGYKTADENFAKFQNTVNSAIWRRKDDVFERRGELIDLRTRTITLTEVR